VRRVIAVDDRRLVAWFRLDDDAEHYDGELWGALLLSEDEKRDCAWRLHRQGMSVRDVPARLAAPAETGRPRRDWPPPPVLAAAADADRRRLRPITGSNVRMRLPSVSDSL
jgi:hypothetical protein